MLRNLLILLVAVGAGYGVYSLVQDPEPAPETDVRPLSPAEAVDRFLSSRTLDAGDLAAMETRHQDETYRQMKNRLFQIAGTVEKVKVSGIDKDVAELSMASPVDRHVVIKIDLNKYESLKDEDRARARFEIVGQELFLISTKDRKVLGGVRALKHWRGQNLKMNARFERGGLLGPVFSAE